MAIARYDGHMSEVARRLGIGRSTLYRKLKEFGLEGDADRRKRSLTKTRFARSAESNCALSNKTAPVVRSSGPFLRCRPRRGLLFAHIQVSCSGTPSHSIAMVVTGESGAVAGRPVRWVRKPSWLTVSAVPVFSIFADSTFCFRPEMDDIAARPEMHMHVKRVALAGEVGIGAACGWQRSAP